MPEAGTASSAGSSTPAEKTGESTAPAEKPAEGGAPAAEPAASSSEASAGGEDKAATSAEKPGSGGSSGEVSQPDGDTAARAAEPVRDGEAGANDVSAAGEPEASGQAAHRTDSETADPNAAKVGGEEEERAGSAAPADEGPRSEFRDAVHAQEPPIGRAEPMYAVADEADRIGEKIAASTEEGARAWAATKPEWTGAPAEDAGRRATELAEEGENAGRLAKSVAGAARASGDHVDRAWRVDEKMLSQGEGDSNYARALLPEREREVAEAQFIASTAEGTRQNHLAAQTGVQQAWEGIAADGPAPKPPGEQAKPPAGNEAATGTAPQAAQALENAQNALAQAGQNDPIASLPTPPSDEDLLRDYQVEDDLLPPIEYDGQKYAWSELIGALKTGDPLGVNRVQQEAADAGARIFPDPDGPDLPGGGRPDVGDNHRDAFRHAFWNALMAKEFGEDSATEIGTGHERHPDRPDRDPAREARAEAMDLYNNEIGRRIAASLGPDASSEDLHRAVEEAVRAGKMVVFNQDYSGLVASGGPEDFPPE
ncbi:DUF6973 domain-containing protein [Amycolatopsis lurida]